MHAAEEAQWQLRRDSTEPSCAPTFPYMIRIAISLAAYEAIAASFPKGREARPPEPLKVGEGVGMWLDPRTLAVLRMERMAGADALLAIHERALGGLGSIGRDPPPRGDCP